MKQHFLGFVFALLAFVLGSFLVQLWELGTKLFLIETLNSTAPISTTPPTSTQLKMGVTPTEIPTITFIGMTKEKGYGGPDYYLAHFQLTNHSPHTIWYWGYSQSYPINFLQFKNKNQWVERHRGWCGTGVDSQSLEGFQSVIFDVEVEDDFPQGFRVGLDVSLTPEMLGTRIWSLPVSISRHPQ